MGMVVRTNTMAMNANRQLGINNTQVSKSLEKLSSGFKINRAADDASGLAISEKMKAQIKGLETASANSQDGISLIQTAEGGAQEIHDMLNRMVELATKSANGTIQNEVDREAIQREVDDLNSEITRIAQSTNFNGINLLDGNLSTGVDPTALSTTRIDATKSTYTLDAAITSAPAANKDSFTYSVGLSNGKSFNFNFKVETSDDGTTFKLVGEDGKNYAMADNTAAPTATDLGNAVLSAMKDSDLGKLYNITDAGDGAFTFEAREAGSKSVQVTSVDEKWTDYASGAITDISHGVTTAAGADSKLQASLSGITLYDSAGTAKAEDSIFSVNGHKFIYMGTNADAATFDRSKIPDDVTIIGGPNDNASDDAQTIANAISQKTGLKVTVGTDAAGDPTLDIEADSLKGSGGLTLQVGDTGDDFNKVTVSVDDLSASGIGTNGLDVSTQEAASSSIQTIKDAINQVSTNRANLGSLQNRLEHTINNLDTTAENMTAANSRIRDTDMAKEMMNYTKMNVLTQAAQAMLAQANQQPQSILQLLQ